MIEIEKNGIRKKAFRIAGIHFIIGCITDNLIMEACVYPLYYIAAKICFFLILLFMWTTILVWIEEVKSGNERRIIYLKFALGIFIFFAIWQCLLWPGNWANDDAYAFVFATRYQIWLWQSFLTNLQYVLSLMFIPMLAGIPIVQIGIISLIMADILTDLYERYNKSKKIWIVFLPLLLFPVIFQSLYTLRMTLYAYLDLYLLFTLIRLKEENRELNKNDFIKFTILGGLLAIWRTEGIYYIIVIPFMLFVLFRKKTSEKKVFGKRIMMMVMILLLLFTSNKLIEKFAEDEEEAGKYKLTACTGTLCEIASQAYKENDTEFIDAMNKVFVQEVVDEGIKTGENPKWRKMIQSTVSNEDVDGFYQEYIKAITKKYPDTFLKERVNTFLNATMVMGDMHNIYEPNETYEELDQLLLSRGILTGSYNEKVRYKILCILYMHPAGNLSTDSIWFRILWHPLIPILILILFLLGSLIKKKWFSAIILSVAMLKIPIVFLAAPQGYFMYYFPAYLMGYFLLAGWIYIKLSHEVK